MRVISCISNKVKYWQESDVPVLVSWQQSNVLARGRLMSLYNVPATSQILIKTLGCVLNLYELLPLPDSAPNPAITTYLHIAQGRATLVMTLFTIGSSIIIILMVCCSVL